MSAAGGALQAKRLRAVFDMIDTDGSGSIERRELMRAAEALGMRPVCERGAPHPPPAAALAAV